MAKKNKKDKAIVDKAQNGIIPVEESALAVVDDTAKARLAAAVMTIKRSQAALRINQFTIAITLKKVYDEELFKAGGFKNVYEFAQSEFDYKKASTNNMIRIATAFLDASDETKIKTIFAKGEIDFKFSQLAELLSIPVESAKQLVESGKIDASTPVKDIRDIVKGIKAQDKGVDAESTATAQGSENGEVNTAGSLETRQNAIDGESEIESLKRQLAEMQAKYETACEIGNKLAADNENLRKENRELREENENLKAEIDNANDDIKNLIGDVAKTLQDNSTLKSENGRLKKELHKGKNKAYYPSMQAI